MRRVYREKQFYQLYVQEPDKAETELERDVRKTLRMMLYSLSGDATGDGRWRYLFDAVLEIFDHSRGQGTLDHAGGTGTGQSRDCRVPRLEQSARLNAACIVVYDMACA